MPKSSAEKQWAAVEKNVLEAEKAERKSRQASAEAYKETGLTKKERAMLPKEQVVGKAKRQRVALKALSEEASAESEAEEILGSSDSPERALVSLRRKNLISAIRTEHTLEKVRDKLLKEEVEILSEMEGEPSGAEQGALREVRRELEALTEQKRKLYESSPEAYFGLHLNELKEYKKSLNNDQLVETPYVKERSDDAAAHLRAGKPVMIYGHLGTGKTELAIHISKKYIGQDPVIISGSKHTSLSELYGHQILSLDKIDQRELNNFTKEVEEKFNLWKEENNQATEAEQNLAHDRILQIYLSKYKGGTISDFFLGPIYRAMAEGRPVIIDEVNAIPHEVLISLNHILTRRVGEKVNVQQNSGSSVTIKEGFGIMMTGNLNQGQEKYLDRQDMDPAFLSRLYKMEYDYLPQKTEGSLGDAAGEENELFHLMLSKVMDQNGNMEVPKETVKKLWNLAKGARVSQDVFAGREVASAYYLEEAGGRAVKYLLKESVLSIRAVNNVLEQWAADGYKQELDYYLWKEFISQSTTAADKAYLYQMFKDRFAFFKSDGWEQNPKYGSGGVINAFDVKAPKNRAGETEFLSPRQVVEFAFGQASERAVWPEMNTAEKNEESEEVLNSNLELLQRLQSFKQNIKQQVVKLKQERQKEV